jgi:hypothetical protein
MTWSIMKHGENFTFINMYSLHSEGCRTNVTDGYECQCAQRPKKRLKYIETSTVSELGAGKNVQTGSRNKQIDVGKVIQGALTVCHRMVPAQESADIREN